MDAYADAVDRLDGDPSAQGRLVPGKQVDLARQRPRQDAAEGGQ